MKVYGAFFNFIILVLLFSSCEKTEPIIPNEEELITTLIYTLTPSAGGDDIIFKFQDIDGDGGNNPVITVDTLSPNTTYSAKITLLNESATPTENVTEEIEEEKEDHQFFFNTANGLAASFAYNDEDANGRPVGLSSTLTSAAASGGQLKITLRHQPTKSAENVSDGDITNAGGETDIEVTFDVIVQ